MARWGIDSDHSVAAFIVRHMMVTNVRGLFNKISGEISFDLSDLSHASVEAIIDASGIYTGIQKRDAHLRSEDFFEVSRYPSIVFRSTAVEPTGDTRLRISGELTLHGITQPVTLDAEYAGPERSPYGETTIGFSARTRINREDYGLVWNVGLESGGVMVGKEVQIFLEIEADLINDELSTQHVDK